MGRTQAVDRVGDLSVEFHSHEQDAVAEGPLLLRAAYRDRDLRDQGFVAQLVMLQQPAADGAGADGNDDIVDGDPVHVLDIFDSIKRQPSENNASVRRYSPVERGMWGSRELATTDDRAPAQRGLEPPAGRAHEARTREDAEDADLLEMWERGRQGAEQAQRVLGNADQAAGEHLELRWHVMEAGKDGLGSGPYFRREVQERPQDLRAGEAVDHRVVHLGHQRNAPVLEAVDEIDLPEGTAAVQGAREDARHLLLELGGRARC